jgi:hypothetical protein
MKITNKLGLPFGLVKAVTTEKHNAENCISATTLLQGIKQILLTERHWEELEDDVSDRVWAIWGQAVHLLMINEGEHDFTEQKMTFKIKGITVTGTIDNYDMKHGIIFDYKTASVNKIKFKDFKDWYLQGMIYAWLLNKNGFNVKKCRFIALLKDHSKTQMIRDRQYPTKPVHVYEFPVTLTELMKIDSFIKERVNEYHTYLAIHDDKIPSCKPEERWDKATTYAVMKSGNKKAVKLFDNTQDANAKAAELGSTYFVETRQGESTKCRQFCSYYHSMTFEKVNITETEEKLAA